MQVLPTQFHWQVKSGKWAETLGYSKGSWCQTKGELLDKISRTVGLIFSALVYLTWYLQGFLAVLPQGARALLHHVNIQHIPAWTHPASLADRSTAQLLSANWITTLFPAAAADVLPLVSSRIRWSSRLPDCAASTDLMALTALIEYAALTERAESWRLFLEPELTSGSLGQRERQHPSFSRKHMEPIAVLAANLI